MIVEILGKKIEVAKPTRVIDLYEDKDKKYLCCYVNNKLKDLTYVVSADAKIDLLDITSIDGANTYQATLRYVIAMAVKNIYPKAKISFNYSISRSIFASVSGIGKAFSLKNLEAIKSEVDRIIKADYPINYGKISKDEAIKYFTSIGYKDKIEGITWLGGEPAEQIQAVIYISRAVQNIGLSVILFTGNDYAKLKDREDFRELSKYVDILIDGRFEQDKADYSRPWVGSSNQNYYFLSDRYSMSDVSKCKNKIEVRISPDNKVLITGMGNFKELKNLLK